MSNSGRIPVYDEDTEELMGYMPIDYYGDGCEFYCNVCGDCLNCFGSDPSCSDNGLHLFKAWRSKEWWLEHKENSV